MKQQRVVYECDRCGKEEPEFPTIRVATIDLEFIPHRQENLGNSIYHSAADEDEKHFCSSSCIMKWLDNCFILEGSIEEGTV